MKNKTILVVDDDAGIVEVTDIILKRLQYTVVTDDGHEAERKVREHTPDLVLLDLKLSGLDGRDICKRLKKNPETRSIPVIIMAADIKTREKAEEAGADGYIYKPFDIEKLEELVKRFLLPKDNRTLAA